MLTNHRKEEKGFWRNIYNSCWRSWTTFAWRRESIIHKKRAKWNCIRWNGYLLLFKDVIKLDVNNRQSGHNKDQQQFRQLLLRLRNGETTCDDWELLMNRTPEKLAPAELERFQDAIRLFYDCSSVGAYNATRLKLLGKPIYQIDAVHTKKSSKHLKADNFGGLESKLFVAKGARIMITRNLWPTAGLVNGATGTIIDLIYHPSAVVPDQPISIIVQFDNYSGPNVKEGKPGCIPICPTYLFE